PPAIRPRQDRHEGRLLRRGLRSLHRAGRRRADVRVPPARDTGRRRVGPHGGRPRVAAAGGLHRGGRLPVRHLHVRAARCRGRSASRQARRERCRDRGLADGEPVPLHRLLRDHARDREGARRAMRPFDYFEPETLDEALESTFAAVATVRIREQATLGGNLAHADPAQDPPVTLLALDGVAVAKSRFAERRIPLDGLFTDLFETSLERGELLLRVELPPLPKGARATYKKFLPATLDDYATISVAAVIATDANASVTHARIALGGAGPVPLRARDAE